MFIFLFKWTYPLRESLRLLEFVTTVAQQVLLILVQSGILISISRDLFYFIVLYSLILTLGLVIYWWWLMNVDGGTGGFLTIGWTSVDDWWENHMLADCRWWTLREWVNNEMVATFFPNFLCCLYLWEFRIVARTRPSPRVGACILPGDHWVGW